jgi:hypothetical protein
MGFSFHEVMGSQSLFFLYSSCYLIVRLESARFFSCNIPNLFLDTLTELLIDPHEITDLSGSFLPSIEHVHGNMADKTSLFLSGKIPTRKIKRLCDDVKYPFLNYAYKKPEWQVFHCALSVQGQKYLYPTSRFPRS